MRVRALERSDMLEWATKADAGENRSHFSMWAMLAAPLLAGTDLAKMKPDGSSNPDQQGT